MIYPTKSQWWTALTNPVLSEDEKLDILFNDEYLIDDTEKEAAR